MGLPAESVLEVRVEVAVAERAVLGNAPGWGKLPQALAGS